MRHEVLHGPAFSALRLDVDTGQSILAQPGSMLAMTPGFTVDVRAGLHMEGRRGIARGLRSMFGGESFFTVVYTAKRSGQHIVLAPDQMGEIRALETDPAGGLLLARGAFLACGPEVSFGLHNAGVHGVLATRGLFFLKTSGAGTLFVTSYGGIVEQTLVDGERFVLDNRNIVAFSDGMPFESVVLAGSLKDSFFSGEGFVVRFTGPGRVLYQTRARPSLGLLRGLVQSIV
ncbi:MAG: TIGR00266 family protein [Planctomycetaceae bacterium]